MKKKKQNKQRKPGVPSQVQRLDKELAATIRLALELGLTEDQIQRRYHVTSAQIDYSRKNGKSLDTLHADTLHADTLHADTTAQKRRGRY